MQNHEFRHTFYFFPSQYRTYRYIVIRERSRNNTTTPLKTCSCEADNDKVAVVTVAAPAVFTMFLIQKFSCHAQHGNANSGLGQVNVPDGLPQRGPGMAVLLPLTANEVQHHGNSSMGGRGGQEPPCGGVGDEGIGFLFGGPAVSKGAVNHPFGCLQIPVVLLDSDIPGLLKLRQSGTGGGRTDFCPLGNKPHSLGDFAAMTLPVVAQQSQSNPLGRGGQCVAENQRVGNRNLPFHVVSPFLCRFGAYFLKKIPAGANRKIQDDTSIVLDSAIGCIYDFWNLFNPYLS